MLPIARLRKTAATSLAAFALTMMAGAPAHAWGKNEQNFLKGAAVATIVGALYLNAQKSRAAPTQRQYQTTPQAVYQPQVQRQYQNQYQNQYQSTGQSYRPPAQAQPDYAPGLHDSAAARAFNSYSAAERRQIQARLAGWGYYQGAIDGTFGPQTLRAVTAYAQDTRTTAKLANVRDAFDLYDSLAG